MIGVPDGPHSLPLSPDAPHPAMQREPVTLLRRRNVPNFPRPSCPPMSKSSSECTTARLSSRDPSVDFVSECGAAFSAPGPAAAALGGEPPAGLDGATLGDGGALVVTTDSGGAATAASWGSMDVGVPHKKCSC